MKARLPQRKNIFLLLAAAALILHFAWKLIPAVVHNQLIYGSDLHHFYSWRTFITESLRAGKVPLWAPYAFGGYPFLASLQPAIFYPSTLIHLLLPINTAFDLEMLLIISGMMFFMYLWLKQFNLSWQATITGMMIFAFSGFTAYRIYIGHISHLRGVVWVPLIFYFIQKALHEKNRLKTLLFLLLGGWAIGFQVTAGFPQFVIYTFLAVLIYVVSYAMLAKNKPVKEALALAALMYVCAALSFLVQIIPTLEGFKYSAVDRSFEYSVFLSVPLTQFITFLSPNFYGDLINGGSKFPATYGYYWETQNYFSLLGLALAIWAIASLRNKLLPAQRKKLIIPMAIITALAVLIALGKYTPFYATLYYLVPGIKGTRVPGRIFGLLTFVIATLSACGLEIFGEYLKAKFPKKRTLAIAALSIIPLIIYIDLCANNRKFIKITPSPVPAEDSRVFTKIQQLKKSDSQIWRIDGQALQNYSFVYGIENIFGANTFSLKAFNELSGAINTPALRRLLNVKYCILKAGKRKAYSTQDFNSLMTTGCSFFPEGEYKVTGALNPSGTSGDSPVAILRILGCGDEIITEKEVGRQFDIGIGLKQGAELKFALLPLPQKNLNFSVEGLAIEPLSFPREQVIYEDTESGLTILENNDFLPRLLFVPYAFVAGKEEAAGILQDSSFNPRQVAVIERPLPEKFRDITIAGPYAKNGLAIPEDAVKIKVFTPEKLVFSVNAPQNGIVFLSQIHYPGWKAAVDNKNADIIKTNYAFCGIPVAAGQHEVILAYRPAYWNFCKAASACMLILTIAIAVYILMKKL